ncbi:MAG: RagB/SusD family nutrient uptake outer membrane protein [Bacteroidetes bacterium]|nr:RagB/SusD family nutrient uptake outer membrane protein [Bacteroidota bacterium]
MKKYFKIKMIILVVTLSMVLNSCKKFLDVTPTTALTTANAYKSAQDAESALSGAYYNFMSSNYYQWEMQLLSDLRSDNAYGGGTGDIAFAQVDALNVPVGSGMIIRDWAELYKAIGVVNILLEQVPNINDPKLTDTRKKQIIGEASFLRAYHYYHLVKLFGGVPLETNSNSADPNKVRLPRSTEKETYDFIVNDLQVAINNLPDTFGNDPSVNKVRATKGAANALMAKVWAQRSDRDYTKVLQYCNAVINSPAGYQLMSNFADIFDGNHYLNSESILEIPFIKGDANGHAYWGLELNYPTHLSDGSISPDEWQRYCVPSVNLAKAYDNEGDIIRKNATISFEFAPWTDENWNPCNDPNIKVALPYKQHNPNSWASGDHTYLLRLADIILLKAEAQNELNDLGGAKATLNIIRNRVSLPNVVAASKEIMRDKILTERRLELAFESQRWDDLVRSGKLETIMNNTGEVKYTCGNGTQSAPIPVIYNATKDKELLPIPQQEIDANPKLVQNPGYN